MRKISLSVLVALFALGINCARDVVTVNEDMQQRIARDVERMNEADNISLMSLDDFLSESYDVVENYIRKIVDKKLKEDSAWLKRTLARQKKVIEKSDMIKRIQSIDWNSSWWNGAEIYAYKQDSPCNMTCVNLCFSQEGVRDDNVTSIFEACIVAECECYSREVEYELEYSGNLTHRSFGSDKDFYDKSGLLIYQFLNDSLMHRDQSSNGQWLGTWHYETQDSAFQEAVQRLEAFFNKTYQNSWVSIPDEHYKIEDQCDLACSQECVSLLDMNAALEVIDSCNTQRCGCYYAQVDSNLCTPSCKKSCILVGGGNQELDECLANSCQCSSQVQWALTQIHEQKQEDHHHKKEQKQEIEHHEIQILIESNTQEVIDPSQLENNEIQEENSLETQDIEIELDEQLMVEEVNEEISQSTMSLAATNEIVTLPKVDTPILQILMTFSIFTVIILAAYLLLLRYEKKQERKRVKVGYEYINEKNAYNEKFNFLYNQEVSASTL